RRHRTLVPLAGVEGAAGIEAARPRRRPRGHRDRPGRRQGFRAFLRDDRLRAARSERAVGRRVAFSHAQTRLKARVMVPIITMPRLMSVGGGALAELPGTLQRLGLPKPLIVTDPFMTLSGQLDRVPGILGQAGISW